MPASAQSLSGNGSSANPGVRIRLAKYFSTATRLYVSHGDVSYGACIGGDQKDASEVAPRQSIEIEYSDSRLSKPIERCDSGHLICRLAAGQTITLAPENAGLDSDSVPNVFCLQLDSDYPAHHYRGTIEVTASVDGTLRVVNCVALEQYLKGVVGPEIGEAAPLEALKAQAIAARTYTIKNLGKLGFSGADLDDTNRCQSYLGEDAENWRCRTAVEQTAGQVLTYQGNLIDAVYATDCGGMTAQGDAPYLQPVSDPDCAGAAPWTVAVATSALQTALAKNGVIGVANIDYIAVHARDTSGRAATLTCTDEATGETEDVSAALIRKALGYDLLRSTLFRVSMSPDAPDATATGNSVSSRKKSANCDEPRTGTVTFIGKGWGHGLGMCQHGAVEMARLDSATDQQILHHFYTGVDIVPLTAGLVASCAAKSGPMSQVLWNGPALAPYGAAHKRRAPQSSPEASNISSDESHSATNMSDGGFSPSPSSTLRALSPRRGF